jgi:MEMO1 family protein
MGRETDAGAVDRRAAMRTLRVRRPAVAGRFYPAGAGELRSAVESALSSGVTGTVPKAIVAPHAGYVFSGPVAGSAYSRVLPARGRVTRVVLLGPAHRAPEAGIAASGAESLATPLGLLRADTAGRDALVDAGLARVDDLAHAAEHSLEVQLPFIQVCLGDVTVLPLAVGDVDPGRVADALELVWGGSETLVVVSTDLSHYHDHATAVELDRRTAAAIVERRPDRLGPYDACGVIPVQGLLLAAERHGLEVKLLDLRTSADTAGDPDRVVGYGAFALA